MVADMQTQTSECLDALRDAARGSEASERALRFLVLVAREHGATWQDVATALGVTRQAAAQRFGG